MSRPLRPPPTAEELTRIAVAVVDRPPSLTMRDVQTLYLFGPAFVPAVGPDGQRVVVKVRSSLEAALGDIRPRVGRDANGQTTDYQESRLWLGAAGYLMLLDQISTVLEGGIEKLLKSDLAGLDANKAGAICGLRNAFLHTYGLVNDPEPNKVKAKRRSLLRHAYRLQVGTNKLVVVGDRSNALTLHLANLPHTFVDLGLLGDLVERIVSQIRERHLAGRSLSWQIRDVDGFLAQFFFTHLDPIEAC